MADEEAIIRLEREAPIILGLLRVYFEQLNERIVSECDVVGLFIVSYLALRRPGKWCSALSKTSLGHVRDDEQSAYASVQSLSLGSLTEEMQSHLDVSYLLRKLGYAQNRLTQPEERNRCLQSTRIIDIFDRLSFNGIKHNADNYINRFMVQWWLGARPVALMASIPSPTQVHLQQAAATRVVTMFRTLDELSRAHRSKLTYMSGQREHNRDPLEFLLHDLRHMEHFVTEDSHNEQVGFFYAMSRVNDGKLRKYFLEVLGYEKSLWYELEYVLADMNCYVSHLLRYLHAKWFAACCQKHRSATTDNNESQQPSEIGTVLKENGLQHVPVDDTLARLLHSEWSSLMHQLFAISEWQMCDERACEDAIAMNDVTLMRIPQLETEQWLRIRDWFVRVGQRRRLSLSEQ